eukprot:jgi/Mesen1/825/ME000111S10969
MVCVISESGCSTAKREDAFPELAVVGNPANITPRDGAFEVTLDGKVLFSRLQVNRLPASDEILGAIESFPELK